MRITERQMLDRLRRRYGLVTGNGYRWVYAEHVRNAGGFSATNTADAVVMDLWPSKGHEIHGHEIKCSRSDWLRELKHPGKHAAVARYCHRWWLVVPTASIVKPGELPASWGLLVATESGVRAVRQAPKRKPSPPSPTFVAALLRAAVKTAYLDADREGLEKHWRRRIAAERAVAQAGA